MSDYIERLIGRGRNGDFWDDLPAAPAAPKPTETNAVRRDSFDISAWDQITDQVRALGEQVARAEEKHPTSPAAYEDLFNLLNQGDPRFHQLGVMRPEYVPQHQMMEGMFSSEDFKWVRNETKYDEYNTALAMLSMERQMDSAMEQVEEVQQAITEALEALEQALEEAEDFICGGMGQSDGEGEDEGGTVVLVGGKPGTEQDVIDRLENALKAAAEATDKGETAGDEAAAKMRQAASNARSEIEADKESRLSYGIEDGSLQRMSYEERKRLSERLNQDRMARIAKLVGNWRMSTDAERRRKVTGAPASVYDVELGNDLAKITASEINDLAVPELEDLFWLRYTTQSMQQWKVRGPERAGQGPIIVVCDESASMGAVLDADGNTREAWSKALSLSLVDQAKRAGRDFIYIGFASANQVWSTTFENGTYDHDKIIDFASHFFAGGTAYERPLTMAMETIGRYEQRRKAKPDVVFITDAECDVAPDFIAKWREVKDRADVRCYGIAIGASGHYTAMTQLSDRVFDITALNASPAGVTEIFRTV